MCKREEQQSEWSNNLRSKNLSGRKGTNNKLHRVAKVSKAMGKDDYLKGYQRWCVWRGWYKKLFQ